jgi:hypothetical protein
MRASSDYVAGDHRTSGGARRSVPSFPNRLANRDKKKVHEQAVTSWANA